MVGRRERPGGIRDRDQSGRAVRPADEDRERRRIVAIHSGAEGGAGRIARCRDDHLRRDRPWRSEEHTSELQSLMRISYAVFCLKKKKKNENKQIKRNTNINHPLPTNAIYSNTR